MLLDTPENLADSDSPVVASEATEKPETITVDEANAELSEIANDDQEQSAEAEDLEVPTDEAVTTTINEDDRRFWAQCDVMAKIADCNRSIKGSEDAIEDMKASIKEEKDLLKGNQIRLQRLASELADIIEGRPLPENPHVKNEKSTDSQTSVESSSDSDVDENAWRDEPTDELLKGVKGMGEKKFDAIMQLAPTAGHLEDLRGEASKAHMSFKEKLPKGFGQSLADAIEDKLIQLVASCSKSAAEQAAEERSKFDQDADLTATIVKIRERLQVERAKDGVTQNDFIPEDLSDRTDPFVDGWHCFHEETGSAGVNDSKSVEHNEDAKNWLTGFFTSHMVANWNGEESESTPSDEEYEDVE